ncbi:putative peptidoglycan glycosyltransferase FtsW [Kiloniella laminariae]|uniref:Probable peptidoglycan glycosyltransferase FtsW n=1 Tax=Kiloniella laminariae TaxID=454162 RepID=A0ABT4LDX8_9PROT|nr:putative peptidoglycan glycosyltransferase FtsW [Kiloniella laminariae]MCZ4279294.1 putative peptidoglycan glycosyltransferase FtsW [Kiloniella laminariae]
MSTFARTDTSIVGRWWWTVDRWNLAALLALMAFGALLVLAASPAAADRIGVGTFQLAKRHFTLLPAAACLMIGISLLSVRKIRRFAVIGLGFTVVLLLATLVFGVEIKGATRWVNLLGFSLQPSEFAKPFFAVTIAWMLASAKTEEGIPGTWIAIGIWLVVISLLMMQPDLGQTVVITAIGGVQLFLAGLPMMLVGVFILLAALGLIIAYYTLPHVTARIDGFLDPATGNSFQVNRSMEAFKNGGLLGQGPGEGTIKSLLPDAHSDFIFSVAGEELGLIACLIIVCLFAFVVLRGFSRLLHENNLFVLLACTGLLTQFGLQAIINMASTLHLIPTKGMTLPFVSYGGSSLLALAVGMGMVLALTRRRPHGGYEA